MGMHTEFHFNSALKEDTPEEVINILGYMLGVASLPTDISHHPLFDTDRWGIILEMDSFSFDFKACSRLWFSRVSDQYFLNVRCSPKNYDQEIQHFINWITPYLYKLDGEFLGLMRYEDDDKPTLLYHPGKWVEL